MDDERADPTAVRGVAKGGIAARFVGGCVRNAVLGRPRRLKSTSPSTSRRETVMRALEAADIKVVPTGLKHGTVTAIVKGRPFELTTLRRDVETDGRRAVVAFTDDWLEDAGRRDFTFNALYADPDGTIYDPFDGRADLAAGRVRFIGDPDTRIAEDRLRVLRFFRFHAWYGKPPLDGAELPGLRAQRRHARQPVGRARAQGAAAHARARRAPADALEAMREAGVLDRWLPEYAGAARLRALMPSARTSPTACAAWRRSCRRADAGAIGKRLKLSTQEALRLAADAASPAWTSPAARAPGAPRSIGWATASIIDRVLLAIDAPGDWRAALAMARGWTPPELPVSGGDALKLGLKPGPQGRRAARCGRALVDRRRFFRRSRRLPRRARSGWPATA